MFTLATVQVRADFTYIFSGQVPTGASSHQFVSDGETWQATFQVDENASGSGSNYVIYENAVLSGTIEFSGGYSADLDIAPLGRVEIFNDLPYEGVLIDGVGVLDASSNSNIRVFALFVHDGSGPLPDGNLPGPGTSFATHWSDMLDPAVQLGFNDGANGSVLYGTDQGTVSFSVVSILIGDVNLDGSVDLLDVAPFVELLSNGGFQAEADINQDGQVNLLDVQPFVDLLSGG